MEPLLFMMHFKPGHKKKTSLVVSHRWLYVGEMLRLSRQQHSVYSP